MVDISPVRSSADRRAFVELPFRLYRDDPLWVPPLRSDIRELIDPERHPFHRHSEVELFIARRGGRVIGRIAAIHNRRHLQYHDDEAGFFGLFESERDEEIAGALLDTASRWLAGRGLRLMRGPANFSSNEDWGLLVHGCDRPPVLMMPYNPPWYEELLLRAGFHPVKNLLAYWMRGDALPERLARGAERIARRHNVTVRQLDLARFSDEIRLLQEIYNTAWQRNWGAVPLTTEEFDYLAKHLRPVVDPRLVTFVYVDEAPAGFCLALPDLNMVLRHMNGRLLPIGWLKALWYMRRVDQLRVLALGVLEPYRRTGAAEMLYLNLFRAATLRGIHQGEFSWILEENLAMRTPLEKLGARVYKTYRLFDRQIA